MKVLCWAIYIYNILKKLCNFVLENLYHTVSYVHNQVNVLRNEYLKNNPWSYVLILLYL